VNINNQVVNGEIFEKMYLTLNAFRYFLQRLSKTFPSPGRIPEDILLKVFRSLSKQYDFLSDLT
jgi:hypothetical protein